LAIETTIECPQCQHRVVTGRSSQPDSYVRCSSCSFIFPEDPAEKLKTIWATRFGWFSFLFGILSFGLGFIAGIPAIYFGIRSLKTRTSIYAEHPQRWMATSGIVMGGVIGAVVGLCLVGILGMVIWFQISSEFTKDPDVVAQRGKEIGTFDSSEMLPYKSERIFGNLTVSYSAEEKREEQTDLFFMGFFPNTIPQTEQAIRAQIRNENLGKYNNLQIVDSSLAQWNIEGKSTPVFEDKCIAKETEIIRYLTILSRKELPGKYILVYLSVCPNQEERISEKRQLAKSIFESFKRAQTAKK